MAKLIKNPHHKICWKLKLISDKYKTKKSVEPTFWYIKSIANSINKLPAKVYKNNKNAALYFLSLPPQIIIMKNKGINTDSKNI